MTQRSGRGGRRIPAHFMAAVPGLGLGSMPVWAWLAGAIRTMAHGTTRPVYRSPAYGSDRLGHPASHRHHLRRHRRLVLARDRALQRALQPTAHPLLHHQPGLFHGLFLPAGRVLHACVAGAQGLRALHRRPLSAPRPALAGIRPNLGTADRRDGKFLGGRRLLDLHPLPLAAQAFHQWPALVCAGSADLQSCLLRL